MPMMAHDDDSRRVEVGSPAARRSSLRISRRDMRAAQGRSAREGWTEVESADGPVSGESRHGRLREARRRRAPGRVLRVAEGAGARPLDPAPRGHASRRSSGARKHPSACPYASALLGRGPPGHHAQTAAGGPRAESRGSGCWRSGRAPATTRSRSPPRLDGGQPVDLRHPARDAGPRARAAASEVGTSSRLGRCQHLPYGDDSFDAATWSRCSARSRIRKRRS